MLLLGQGPVAAEQSGQIHLVNQARQGKAHRQAVRQPERAAPQYFVEFRARYALSYGHTFLVHGRLNANGETGAVTADQVAGLHPAGDGPQLWSVGHVVPVPAETGASDGDTEDEYIAARFRIVLDEATYRRVAAHIRQKQAKPSMWHAVLYNCNTWVAEVAHYMGLQAPGNNLLYPADFINTMKEMNGGAAVVENTNVPAVIETPTSFRD
jgi:hypothetical protein